MPPDDYFKVILFMAHAKLRRIELINISIPKDTEMLPAEYILPTDVDNVSKQNNLFIALG